MSEPENEAKVVLVTGAARGIGRCCTRFLLDRGWRVIGLDSAREAGDRMAAGAGVDERFAFIRADVRDEAAVAAATAEVADRFGRIDGVINNAAIASPGGTPLEQLDLEAWRAPATVSTYVKSTIASIRPGVSDGRRTSPRWPPGCFPMRPVSLRRRTS